MFASTAVLVKKQRLSDSINPAGGDVIDHAVLSGIKTTAAVVSVWGRLAFVGVQR